MDQRNKKRIVIVSDIAIELSGVATTLVNTVRVLRDWGHVVLYMTPITMGLYTMPLWGVDKFFKLALPWPHAKKITDTIEEFNPDHIHISTEASLGQMVHTLCLKRGWKFTTAFHTLSADFLERLIHMPAWITWVQLREFHSKSSAVMTYTPSTINILKGQGFKAETLKIWTGGVDTRVFYPRPRDPVKFPDNHRPIRMYIGRISVEKGIEDFLKIRFETGGSKYLVGEGPQREELQRKYPDAVFLGYLKGDELATAYSNADVLVFPSKVDTFGFTITEALATGTPVAAYPAPGPIDIITPNNPKVGALNEDLAIAIEEALANGDRNECVRCVKENYTWEIATQQFLGNLVPIKEEEGPTTTKKPNSSNHHGKDDSEMEEEENKTSPRGDAVVSRFTTYAGNFVHAMQTVSQLTLIFVFAVKFAILTLVTIPFKLFVAGTFKELLLLCPTKLPNSNFFEICNGDDLDDDYSDAETTTTTTTNSNDGTPTKKHLQIKKSE